MSPKQLAGHGSLSATNNNHYTTVPFLPPPPNTTTPSQTEATDSIFPLSRRLSSGKIYKRLELSDPARTQYGLILKWQRDQRRGWVFFQRRPFVSEQTLLHKMLWQMFIFSWRIIHALETMIVLHINGELMEYIRNKTKQFDGSTIWEECDWIEGDGQERHN